MAVLRPDEVPQGRAAVAAVDDPDALSPRSGPAQQGIQGHLGLIRIFAVEVHGHNAGLHPITSFPGTSIAQPEPWRNGWDTP